MKKFIIISLALFTPTYSMAKPPKILKASEIFPYLLQFRALAPEKRDGLNLHYKFTPANLNFNNLPLTNGAQKYIIELDNQGYVKNIPNDNVIKTFTFEKPENLKVSIGLEIRPNLKLDENISMGEIQNCVNDFKNSVSEVAGPMSFMVPKLESLKFKNINSAYALSSTGQKINLNVANHELLINPKANTFKNITNIVFSNAPNEASFEK